MNLKILHQPINIGNQARILSKYERIAGADSRLLVKDAGAFQFETDGVLYKEGTSRWIGHIRTIASGLRAPFKYDVIHSYFGQSLLTRSIGSLPPGINFFDLAIAKKLGKRVIHTFQGCDARIAGNSNQRNMHTPCRSGGCSRWEHCKSSADHHRLVNIARLSELCDRLFFLNPELGHELPDTAIFMPYASADIESIEAVPPESTGKKPIIVHAPTDPTTKGTPQIVEVMETLSSQYPFDFRLVQNLPHKEAMRLYRQADIVIDQILCGWYGGFAVEAMAMAKPVVCAIRDADLKFVPRDMVRELPIIRTEPDTLYNTMDRLLRERDTWSSIGRASRQFVEKWHNPRRLAQSMLECYQHPNAAFHLNWAQAS